MWHQSYFKSENPSIFSPSSAMTLWEQIKHLPQVPCARSSLLMGMATAASVGTIQVVFGRGLQRSMNWSVGSFLFISILGWYV